MRRLRATWPRRAPSLLPVLQASACDRGFKGFADRPVGRGPHDKRLGGRRAPAHQPGALTRDEQLVRAFRGGLFAA